MVAISISHDGKRLFAWAPDRGTYGKYYLCPLDGAEPTPITGLEAGETPIQWTADSRALYVRLPKLYVQGRYAYAFVGRALDVPLNRSNDDLELEFIVNRSFSCRALGSWQRTHGGLQFDPHGGPAGNPNLTPLQFLTHDRLLQSNHWHFGGAATFSLTRSMALNVGVVTFLSGANTHYGTGITIGMSWSFSRGFTPTINTMGARLSTPRMLASFNSP